MSRKVLIVSLLLATGVALADEAPGAERATGATEAQAKKEDEAGRAAGATDAQAQKKEGAKLISGMSILGNQEAPKSLVIVPWKSSDIGASFGISTMLDDSRQPIDKEVFMRALTYYELRSGMKP